MKGAIMSNLRYTIFYMEANVLQESHICISVPLSAQILSMKRKVP